MAGLAAAAILTGGVLSWFASTRPDGLEWSVERVAGEAAPTGQPGALHALLGRLQGATTLVPGSALRGGGAEAPGADGTAAARAGTSVAGLLGGLLVLVMALGIGSGLRFLRRRTGDR